MEFIFKGCIGTLFFLALVFRMAEYIRFKKLVKAGMNMSTPGNELVKQIKRRFTDCFTLNKPVNNTLAFVEKSVGHSCLGKLSVFTITVFYVALFAGMYYGLITRETFLVYGLFSFTLYYASVLFFNAGNLRNIFVMSAVDYLDNTLRNRLTINNPDKRRMMSAKPHQECKEDIRDKTDGHKSVQEAAATINNDDSALIESIIDEFIL